MQYRLVIFSFSCFLTLIFIVLIAKQRQQTYHILAIGDSLTAGYYNYGRSYHPYTISRTRLFEWASIPVEIDERGVNGERVVPAMSERLRNLLKSNVSYDWILILGGTNDLNYGSSAEKIFKEGLEPMYKMCLNHSPRKLKLIVMTIIANLNHLPYNEKEKKRQALNLMIRDYVSKTEHQSQIFLVDLDKHIPYNTTTDENKYPQFWGDSVHLTPAGYDRVARLVFDTIKNQL